MRGYQHLVAWFLLFSMLWCGTALAEENEELKLYARSAVLMDGATGRILYESGNRGMFPMASTTKIMTCILALEHGNLEDLVTFSKKAAAQPDVQLNAREGGKYRLEDLLYSLMLESHNDTAVAIAEHIGGSVEGFAALMNQKAEELGCYSTWFVTPNGLDAVDAESGKEHSTTAGDLAAILRYCVNLSPKKEEFLTITRTQSRTFSDSEGKYCVSCQNHNALLHMMDGALSGKTGFTGKAGYCYVGAVEQDGKQLILALLGCGWPPHKTYKWTDARKLVDYGLSKFQYREFAAAEVNPKMAKVSVEGGQTPHIGQKAEIGIRLESEPFGMLMREDEQIQVKWDVPKTLQAPVWEGMPIGAAEYQIDGVTWKTDTVVADRSVEKIDLEWCLRKVLEEAGILAVNS